MAGFLIVGIPFYDVIVGGDLLKESYFATLQDLRLVRDKFTHVSRGFAFVHFYSVS